VRIESLTDWPERLEAGAEVWVEGDPEATRIDRVETGGRVAVLYLSGVESREAAETLTGRYLEAPARDLPDGAYFWDQLIGLEVRDRRGAVVGELVEIFRAGGNEVYRVLGPTGERLVPALRSAVLEIDLEHGRMTVADDDADEVR
jgi:16S rRNA processing protein RimM